MLLALLVITAVLLMLPAVLCCWAGGVMLLFGVLALVSWLQLGWWVLEEVLRWRRQSGDEYV